MRVKAKIISKSNLFLAAQFTPIELFVVEINVLSIICEHFFFLILKFRQRYGKIWKLP